MLAELLAAARALPALVKAAERIADGVQAFNKQQQEKVAKERLDEKNRVVDDFIDGVPDDDEIQRGGGVTDETPTGGS